MFEHEIDKSLAVYLFQSKFFDKTRGLRTHVAIFSTPAFISPFYIIVFDDLKQSRFELISKPYGIKKIYNNIPAHELIVLVGSDHKFQLLVSPDCIEKTIDHLAIS